MDVEIEVGDGNTGQCEGIADGGDDDSNDGREMNATGQTFVHYENGSVPEPHVGMEFHSDNAAKMFYEDYARRLGFTTCVSHCNRSGHDGMATSREFFCSTEGVKRRPGEGCEAMLRIEISGERKWVVTKFIKEHSHSIVVPRKANNLKPKRYVAATMNNVEEGYNQGADLVPSGIMYVSVDGNRATVERNQGGKDMCHSELNRTGTSVGSFGHTPRYPIRRTLGRDAQNLLDYFKKMQAENPGFYYAIQLDEENRMANAFWSDARSRTAYSHFGDAVILDTSYRTNHFRVPIAPFTGVNHHGQTILFGCALLLDESEATFVWLFKTFLAAMDDHHPVTLTTEKDGFIQAAVRQVFPRVRHCVNKWQVLKEGQERMSRVCLAHPNFEVELYNCINRTETIEEFESFWASILEKYDLKGNAWLQSIYDARKQWAPVYLRDSFFAAIIPSLGYEISFFDGYVNQQTTLPMFFRQYERALENSFEREIEADFDTTHTSPVLRTPSPMEKQAASLYTKRIFSKFQEELVETFVYTANRIDGNEANSTFRVAKFEDDHRAYAVTLNTAEMKANCSCRMFEYSGILCRHVLTVFTVTNILTLPSHYILKRWTRNAKSVNVSDEQSEVRSHESLTVRYNNLCKEAIRFAEEWAIATETYGAALASLRECGKKVAAVRNSVSQVLPSSSKRNGVCYDGLTTSAATPEIAPLLWPRQDEIIRRFNLNENGVSNQPMSDSNAPHMCPVSLGDGLGNNMVVLIWSKYLLNIILRNAEQTSNTNLNCNCRQVVLPCLKSMTWVMENKTLSPVNRIAVINLKLQDYSRIPVGESEVKFSLSRVTLEPMLRSMAHISEQLSTPMNKVAIINLKLQDTASGESEVKFQVSRDTLGAMLRSMAYIREQLNTIEPQDNSAKRLRK